MFVIAILIIMLLILITFAAASYALFLNYKNATEAFYNYNKSLVENIAQSSERTMTNLGIIANSLNELADQLEEVDTSVDLYLDRIEHIEELVAQETAINKKINEIVTSIDDNTKRLRDTKLLTRRKFKNYN